MLGKFRYLLILLLFALAGSLQHISSRGEVRISQSALFKQSAVDLETTPHDYLSAEIPVVDSTISTPVVSLDHKAVLRQRSDLRFCSSKTFDVRTVIRLYSRSLHSDAVDYYVFTLGRILI